MGRSQTITVTVTEVSKMDTEATLEIDRDSGFPGIITISGRLFKAGTNTVIQGKSIDILVNGSKVGSATTTSVVYGGYYTYKYTVGSGRYTFQARFNGDATYNPDYSPVVTGTYAKVETDFDLDVNPLYGEAPLSVATLGRLYRVDTTAGVGAVTVDLYRNNVKVASKTTKAYTPGIGSFEFHETLGVGIHNYYVRFAGNNLFEGCEVSDGTTVVEGIPDDEEPPVDGIGGAGALLLLLLVLSQE